MSKMWSKDASGRISSLSTLAEKAALTRRGTKTFPPS
jgi:hypothetical protein